MLVALNRVSDKQSGDAVPHMRLEPSDCTTLNLAKCTVLIHVQSFLLLVVLFRSRSPTGSGLLPYKPEHRVGERDGGEPRLVGKCQCCLSVPDVVQLRIGNASTDLRLSQFLAQRGGDVKSVH